MKHLILTTTLILFSYTIVIAQEKLKGNKVVTTQNRQVESFDKIVVKDDFKIFVTNGSKSEITVITDENLQEAITTRVSDGILEIYYAQKIGSSKELLIQVILPENGMSTIESRDKSKIIAESELKLDSLHIIALDRSEQKFSVNTQAMIIDLNTDSSVELNINATKKTVVNAEQNANAKIQLKTDLLQPNLFNNVNFKITGTCRKMELIVQDEAKYFGKDMICDDVFLNASDKSFNEVNASKKIYLDVENDAKIYLYNQPKITLNSFKDKASIFKK